MDDQYATGSDNFKYHSALLPINPALPVKYFQLAFATRKAYSNDSISHFIILYYH